jgi:hypothetical protein
MTKDTIVTFRAPDGFSPDPLTDLLRQGARDLMLSAKRKWRKLDGQNRVPEIIEGVEFRDGIKHQIKAA